MAALKRGVSLIEIAIAAAILAVLGMPVLSLLSTGSRETAMSEDYIAAEVLASRFLEEKLALEFQTLEAMIPKDETARVSIDGNAPAAKAVKIYSEDAGPIQGYKVELKMSRARPDLLQLEATVLWKVQGRTRKYSLLRLRGREYLSAAARMGKT